MHIVASYRAQVNDSEAVDAFGKVENFSAIVVRSFQRKKRKEELKSRKELSLCERAKEKTPERRSLLFFLYRDFHVRADLAMKLHGDFVFADYLDRIGQRDLALVDVIALRFQCIGDVR